MWPRDEDEERGERTITELFNIDWRETSFVPAGDNPEARLVMWKQDPGLTDEEIEEILQETERGSGVTTQLRKESDVLAERERRARELMKAKPGELTIEGARVEVWATNPELREAYRQAERDHEERMAAIATGGTSIEEAVVEKAREPYAALHEAAREALPDLYRRCPSAAVSEISKSRPDLREGYERAVR